MADEKTPQKDPRQVAREAELARQEEVRKAIFDRTHDKDGKPKPIVPEG